MCGRFYRTKELKELQARFQLHAILAALEAQYNIAPTEEALVIAATDKERVAKPMRFGFPNPWIEGGMLLNMRAESFATKPGFRRYLENQRCLVPADGFYEWRRTKKGSFPFRFGLAAGGLFGFAGICDQGGFAIITTESNPLVGQVHNRMPVILRKEEEDLWLDAQVKEFHKLAPLLAPYPADAMSSAEVSKLVNSAKYKTADCLTPRELERS
jgi:putative SOS response-associated peptidase YedK